MTRLLKVMGWTILSSPLGIYALVLMGRWTGIGGDVSGWIGGIGLFLVWLASHFVFSYDLGHRMDMSEDEKKELKNDLWFSWRYPSFFFYLLCGGYRKKGE